MASQNAIALAEKLYEEFGLYMPGVAQYDHFMRDAPNYIDVAINDALERAAQIAECASHATVIEDAIRSLKHKGQ